MKNNTTLFAAAAQALEGDSARRHALERALAETEERVERLSREIEAATTGSAETTAVRAESERLVAWLREKLHALRQSLENLEKDAKALEHLLARRAVELKDAAMSNSETLQGLKVDVEHLRERIESLRGNPKPVVESREP